MKYAPTMIIFFALIALRDIVPIPFWALIAVSLVAGGAIGALVDRRQESRLESFELKVLRAKTGGASASEVQMLTHEVAWDLRQYRDGVKTSNHDQIATSLARLNFVGFGNSNAVEMALADDKRVQEIAESLVHSLRTH
jgi:hypothetical protein